MLEREDRGVAAISVVPGDERACARDPIRWSEMGTHIGDCRSPRQEVPAEGIVERNRSPSRRQALASGRCGRPDRRPAACKSCGEHEQRDNRPHARRIADCTGVGRTPGMGPSTSRADYCADARNRGSGWAAAGLPGLGRQGRGSRPRCSLPCGRSDSGLGTHRATPRQVSSWSTTCLVSTASAIRSHLRRRLPAAPDP